MTPDERIAEAVAGFQKLAVPPRPDWAPPQRVAVVGRVHPHRRLVMKLGIGSLAAAVLIGAGLMLAAAPAVTLAQAVKEVQKHRLVRYKWVKAMRPEFKGQMDVGAVNYTCEDLDKRRECSVQIPGGDHPTAQMSVINVETKRILVIEAVPPAIAEAVKSGPVAKRSSPPAAFVGGIPKAKLVAELGKPGVLDRLREVIVARDKEDHPKVMIEQFAAQPPLLDRIKAVAESKTSVTTRVQFDGKPAVKIVGTEDKRDITIWLDPATKLPVRIERPHRYSPDVLIAIESGFEWDFALPAGLTLDALFSTDPPPGVPLTIVVE